MFRAQRATMMSSHKSTFVMKNSKDSIAKDVGWGEMVVIWLVIELSLVQSN
jgi:hypothetical protein